MRNSSRRTNAVAILTAAAGLAASVQFASAQTWVNPNTGNWSTGANWVGGVAPASSATTALLFNATGTQTYTATNDLANPFQFGSLTLNNSGTGSITIAGNAFTGGTATGGAFINVTSTGTGTSLLSNGGTLFALQVQQGAVQLNGGNWNLLSTLRRNDNPVGGIDTGPWSLSVGESAAGVSRFTQSGGNLTASQGFIAVANGSTSVATFSNGAVATFDPTGTGGRFGINAGSGTININSGAQVHARLIEGGRQGNNQNVGFNLDGANTVLDGGQFVFPRVTGTGVMNITNGAHFNMISTGGSAGNSFIAGGADPVTAAAVPNSATVNVIGVGSQFNVLGQQSAGQTGNGTLAFTAGATGNSSTMFMASNVAGVGTWSLDGAGTTYTINTVAVLSGGGQTATGDQLPAGTSTLNVSNGAQLHGVRFTFGQNLQGQTNINVSGSNSRIDTATGAGTGSWAMAAGDNTSAATINVSNGAVVAAPQGAFFFSGGIANISGGTTVFNLSNATANVGFNQISNSEGSVGTMNVNAAGVVNCGTSMLLGLAGNTTAALNVNGASAVVNAPIVDVGFGGSTALGDPLPGGTNFVNVTNGAQINTTGLGLNIADSIDTLGTVVVSGANSKITGTGTAQLAIGTDNGAIGTLNINNGGAVSMAGNAFISAGTTSVARVTIDNGSLAMAGNFLIAINGGNDTGAGTVTVTNNGVLTAANTVVASGGTLNVGVGASKGRHTTTQDIVVNGNLFYNAGTLTAGGTLGVGGNVILSSANRNGAGTPSNKKMLEVGQATLTSSGVIDLNDNDMLIHENNRQKYENFVKAARNNGLWNQPGITSTAAKNSVPQNKNLGVLSGAEYLAVNATLFNGKAVVAGDTVIKFTFNGDTDLNGVVNFDDYSRVDSGFNNGRSGWLNGDFDYNGVINFDDYSLIDQGFNTQGATVLSAAGDPAGPGFDRTIVAIGSDAMSMIGTDGSMVLRPTNGPDVALTPQGAVGGANLNAVPEPATLSLVGLGMLGALRRRRRNA